MLRLDSLHPSARKLIEGEPTTVSQTVPWRLRGARPATCRVSSVLFKTRLTFEAPVVLASVGFRGDPLEMKFTTLVLQLKACQGEDLFVQFALDLSAPFARFLSPMEMRSHHDYELFLCDDRLRSEGRAELRLERLELVSVPQVSEEVSQDLVSFDFEDDVVQANKFALAAHSSVFKRQFFGELLEASSGRVRVTDFGAKSFRVFLEMLLDSRKAYMTLQRPGDSTMVEVWAIADKYCAWEVRSIVEAAVLQSACEHCVELLQTCRRFRSAALAQRICDKVSRCSEDPEELLREVVAEDYLPAKRRRLS